MGPCLPEECGQPSSLGRGPEASCRVTASRRTPEAARGRRGVGRGSHQAGRWSGGVNQCRRHFQPAAVPGHGLRPVVGGREGAAAAAQPPIELARGANEANDEAHVARQTAKQLRPRDCEPREAGQGSQAGERGQEHEERQRQGDEEQLEEASEQRRRRREDVEWSVERVGHIIYLGGPSPPLPEDCTAGSTHEQR